MPRAHATMAFLALLLAAPQGAGALSAAGVARRAEGDASAETVRPRANEAKDVNLVQEAELSLGSFEVKKSIAVKTVKDALQQLRGRVFKPEEFDGPAFYAKIFWTGCSYVLTCTIIAVLYRQFLAATPADLEKKLEVQTVKDNFEYPLFSFDKCDPQLALCSSFCLCIRWPTTVSNERLALLAFWPAFFMYACLEGFTGIFAGLLWFVHLVVCVYFRQKIREHYNLTRGTGMSYLEDILTWACCCFCAGAQEAKQVEYVRSP